MKPEPFTPLANAPWIRWIDRTEVPAVVIGLIVFAVFIPFYELNALPPQMPLQGSVFPPALALALMFLLLLTRGACNDLRQLIVAGRIDTHYLESLTAGPWVARVELLVGLLIGVERVYAQIRFGLSMSDADVLTSPGAIAVYVSIIGYTIVQVHLLTFCVRQVRVFRQIASSFQVDLMRPELNNTMSNPLIRFTVVGLIGMSFALLIFEMAPYASMQRRLLTGALLAGFVWLVLIIVSFIPLLILKSRIAVAKAMEINLIRQVLDGDTENIESSRFGKRLADFSPADLMYYEDRIKNIWEWPFEMHIRRLVIFGLLPPLTWILAAAVEVVFETLLIG